MPQVTNDADREERDQLHDRLERDRRDEALVALGGVEMPRAEQDREDREQQRDPERRVGADRRGLPQRPPFRCRDSA